MTEQHTSDAEFKRYVFSIRADMFRRLEEVAAERAKRSGQFISVAALIRDAIRETYIEETKERVE